MVTHLKHYRTLFYNCDQHFNDDSSPRRTPDIYKNLSDIQYCSSLLSIKRTIETNKNRPEKQADSSFLRNTKRNKSISGKGVMTRMCWHLAAKIREEMRE